MDPFGTRGTGSFVKMVRLLMGDAMGYFGYVGEKTDFYKNDVDLHSLFKLASESHVSFEYIPGTNIVSLEFFAHHFTPLFIFFVAQLL